MSLMIASLIVLFMATKLNAQENLSARYDESVLILEELRKNISVSSRTEARLADEISELENDRSLLNEKLLNAAANSRALEQKIQRTSTRVVDLENSQRDLQKSLSQRRTLLSEVIGALQRMGRNPPPALLITPQDALVSVRSAILLGSVVPEIRSETQILKGQLDQLKQLGQEINAQRHTLTQSLEIEATEEHRLAILIKTKKKLSIKARENLAAQSLKAANLAANATNLTNLIEQLQSEIEAVNEATQAAKSADAKQKLRQNKQIASARKDISKPDFSDTSRISPAVGFIDAKGHLIKPVNGVEVKRFGERDELGDSSSGIAIATRINARVISPADGWVVYSGPFRSYGQLLILNVGAKHHIVMSGMEKLNTELGQFVLVGEPVGIMGTRRIASTGTIDIGLSRPVLEIEFRKGNKPIDPAPWWQKNTDKRLENDS